MTRTLIAAVLAVLAASCSAPEAEAQTACWKRETIVKMLSDKFGEQRHGGGPSGQSALIEVYTSPSGSWTILATGARGISCIVAAGDHWSDFDRKIEGKSL